MNIMSLHIVTIDSRDRLSSSSSSSEFSIELPIAINGICSATLLQANIPNSLYNIKTGVNNIMRWTHAGTFSYTIPPGNYTISALLTDIQTGMQAADANTWVLSYSTTTMKVTISALAAFIITWSSTNTPYYELGFTSVDSVSGTSITGDNVANLAQPYNLYLTIPQLGLSGTTSNNNDRYTYLLPVLENAGMVINYSSEANFEQKINYPNAISIHRIDVYLRLRNNIAASLNAADWSFTIQYCGGNL